MLRTDVDRGSASSLAIQTSALGKVFRVRRRQYDNPCPSTLAAGFRRLRHLLSVRQVVALHDVSLQVRRGEFYTLVGPNGAGKTTLLKLLACLYYPDSGTAWVDGWDIRENRRRVRAACTVARSGGWLGTHYQLTIRQNLLFYARLCGLAELVARSRVDQALSLLGMSELTDEYPWALSAGQAQKMNLAQAFLVRTPIVLLDEPTAHLDPFSAATTRSFIRDTLNRQLGQTIIMTTHVMDEAEVLSDRVGVIDSGKLALEGTPSQLIASVGEQTWEFVLENASEQDAVAFATHPAVACVLNAVHISGQRSIRLRFALRDPAGPIDPVVRVAINRGLRITRITRERPTLEEAYLTLIGGKT
ncbi:MAG: ABC transporter ATP-binding protein [Armatimonadota bacterium]